MSTLGTECILAWMFKKLWGYLWPHLEEVSIWEEEVLVPISPKLPMAQWVYAPAAGAGESSRHRIRAFPVCLSLVCVCFSGLFKGKQQDKNSAILEILHQGYVLLYLHLKQDLYNVKMNSEFHVDNSQLHFSLLSMMFNSR